MLGECGIRGWLAARHATTPPLPPGRFAQALTTAATPRRCRPRTSAALAYRCTKEWVGGWWDWRVFVPQRPKLALGVGRFVRCIVSILVFVRVGFRMAVALRERGKRGGPDPFFPSGWGDLPLTFEGEGQGAAPFVVHPPPFPHPLHPPPHSKGPTKSRKVDHPEGLPV